MSSPYKRKAPKRSALLLIALSLLGGCATTTSKDVDETTELPAAFSQTGSHSLESKWWESFGDPLLNQRIETALTANHSLEATWQSVEEARATLSSARSGFFPTLDLEATASESKEESAPASESYSVGFEAAYELDLWGRIRHSSKAENARLQASFFDYQSAALSLAAEVASIHFQLQEYLLQRELVASQLLANRKVLESLNTRFQSGLVRSSDILRQKQLIETSFEQSLIVDAQIALFEHALSVLLGDAPQTGLDASLSAKELPDLPELPQTGIPAELVARRPDVLAAFHRLEAANADLAAAVADRFPTLSLTATLASLGTNIDDLFEEWIREIGAEIIAPITDGGNRRAEVRRNQAIAKRSLSEYSQSILVALQEVEDALVLESSQGKQIASKIRQVELAENAYQRLQTEYINGVSQYLDLLTAQIDLQALQRELVDAQRIKIEYRIALFRALAGPVPTSAHETIAQ